jgi:hypothetical protein
MLINSQAELSLLISESKKIENKSGYRFIRAHGGYRNGKIHMAIGPSSGGKSTLTRSLIIDFLINLDDNEHIHVHLSEESSEEFLIELGSTGLDFKLIKKIKITSEQDDNHGDSAEKMFLMLNESLSDTKTRAFFFDNITTSFCYMDKKTEQQAKMGRWLKALAKSHNIPVILIAHTGGDSTMANSRLIEMNDVRGGKSIVNLVEFMYILQPFFVNEKRHNMVRVVKHRGFNVEAPYFQLEYAAKPRMFTCDKNLTFKEFKELFKERNVL